MNRKEIDKLWNKAIREAMDEGCLYTRYHFAELVAAAERNKLAAWMIQRGYATGHGDTTENLLNELDWQVLANWSSAMKTGAENEREACAKVADDTDPVWYSISAAIRARGQA